MNPTCGEMRTRFRPVFLLVVALLGAAAAAHGIDHLSGAACETSPGAQSHACLACSALHGAHLPDVGPALPAPAPRDEVAPVAVVVGPPLADLCLPGPPRAPPFA
jgi:hypothetical protein